MLSSSLFIAFGLLVLSLVISAVTWSRLGPQAKFAGKEPGLWLGFAVLALSIGILVYYADSVLLPAMGSSLPGGNTGFWVISLLVIVVGWWFLPAYGTYLLSKSLGRNKS